MSYNPEEERKNRLMRAGLTGLRSNFENFGEMPQMPRYVGNDQDENSSVGGSDGESVYSDSDNDDNPHPQEGEQEEEEEEEEVGEEFKSHTAPVPKPWSYIGPVHMHASAPHYHSEEQDSPRYILSRR